MNGNTQCIRRHVVCPPFMTCSFSFSFSFSSWYWLQSSQSEILAHPRLPSKPKSRVWEYMERGEPTQIVSHHWTQLVSQQSIMIACERQSNDLRRVSVARCCEQHFPTKKLQFVDALLGNSSSSTVFSEMGLWRSIWLFDGSIDQISVNSSLISERPVIFWGCWEAEENYRCQSAEWYICDFLFITEFRWNIEIDFEKSATTDSAGRDRSCLNASLSQIRHRWEMKYCYRLYQENNKNGPSRSRNSEIIHGHARLVILHFSEHRYPPFSSSEFSFTNISTIWN
jgi:hypothetical protein